MKPKHAAEIEVVIPSDGRKLEGSLCIPLTATGVVLFAHGSGSSRHSPRNVAVARGLQDAGLGTLLFDLLSVEEAEARTNVFDITLLARRLVDATRWLQRERLSHDPRTIRIGFFGASTGAAAALVAAAELGDEVAAVVSRGGRPDLAGPALEKVKCPVLLIVGGGDYGVIELNRDAFEALPAERKLEIVPGATHLFEESGAMERVTELAIEWFSRHFVSDPRV